MGACKNSDLQATLLTTFYRRNSSIKNVIKKKVKNVLSCLGLVNIYINPDVTGSIGNLDDDGGGGEGR